jgi:hypothetical protein
MVDCGYDEARAGKRNGGIAVAETDATLAMRDDDQRKFVIGSRTSLSAGKPIMPIVTSPGGSRGTIYLLAGLGPRC